MRIGGLSLLLLLASGAAQAGGQGAHLIAVVPEGGGKARTQVAIEDPALQRDFAAGVSLDRLRAAVGSGGAQATGITSVVAQHEKVETVLAFDQSGSFARFWTEAFGLAKDVFGPALDRDPSRQVRVVTFGLRTDSSALVQGSAGLNGLLSSTQATRANQKATRLKAAILDAARLAAADVPLSTGGVRDLVVFTDGGEESDAYDVDDLVKQLAALGVRVHVVCFYRGAPGQGRLASRLDHMKRLAEGTGGAYVQVDDHAAAASALARVAASPANLYWVEVAFCGVPGARPVFDDHLSLEVLTKGVRSAWTDGVAFSQHAEGNALHDCPSAAASAAPSLPLSPAEIRVQAPAAAPPNPSVATASAEVPKPTIEVPIEESRFPFGWLLLALLLLMALVFFLRRQREEPAVVAAPAPVVPVAPLTAVAATPVAAPAVAPAPAPAWTDPLATLPETRLVVVRGPSNLEPAYRLHKREMAVGGAPGPDVDVVFPLPQLSGRHASFQLYPTGAVFVTDLRSTNGTFVDGRRLGPGERVQLQPGQAIQLSQQVELKLEQPGHQLAAPIAPGGSPEPAASAGTEEAPRAKAKTVYSPLTPRDKE